MNSETADLKSNDVIKQSVCVYPFAPIVSITKKNFFILGCSENKI